MRQQRIHPQSIATSISFFKGAYYVGGYARNLSTNLDEAFAWIGGPGTGPTGPAGGADTKSATPLSR